MRRSTIILTVLFSAAIMLAACGTAEQDAATQMGQEATEAAQGSIGQATEAAFADMKTKVCSTAQGMIDEWNQKITDLETRKAALPEMAQKPLEEPMKVLMDKRDALGEQFKVLEAADEASFPAEQEKLQQSMAEVGEAFNNVTSLF
jgi:hypothetical protein